MRGGKSGARAGFRLSCAMLMANHVGRKSLPEPRPGATIVLLRTAPASWALCAAEDDVISMPPALQAAPEACRVLFAYWNEIRERALVPYRSRLDPLRLLAILPRIQIVELQSHGVIRCTLAGTGLRDLFGFDLTGHNMIQLTPPAGRATRSYRHWAAVAQPCGSVFAAAIRFPSGARAPVGGVALPLLPDREGGSPLVVLAIALVADRGWINERRPGFLGLPARYAFIDIGAGIPDRVDPPDEWAMDDIVPAVDRRPVG
jgi:hypothetical protein